jgi:PleD family two-component response regulator
MTGQNPAESKKKMVLLFLPGERERCTLEEELKIRGHRVASAFSAEDILLMTSYIKYDIMVAEIDPRDELGLSLPRTVKKKSPGTIILGIVSPDSTLSIEKLRSLGVEAVFPGPAELLESPFLARAIEEDQASRTEREH